MEGYELDDTLDRERYGGGKRGLGNEWPKTTSNTMYMGVGYRSGFHEDQMDRTREKNMDIHFTLCCGGETKEGGRGDRQVLKEGEIYPPPPQNI